MVNDTDVCVVCAWGRGHGILRVSRDRNRRGKMMRGGVVGRHVHQRVEDTRVLRRRLVFCFFSILNLSLFDVVSGANTPIYVSVFISLTACG